MTIYEFNIIEIGSFTKDALIYRNQIIENLKSTAEQLDVGIKFKDSTIKSAIKSITQDTYAPKNNHPALRVDQIHEEGCGVVNTMGTTATISRRILATIHKISTNEIKEMIFITDSDKEAWHKENGDPGKRVALGSNGNRSSTSKLVALIEEMENSLSIPIHVIEITSKEAIELVHNYLGV